MKNFKYVIGFIALTGYVSNFVLKKYGILNYNQSLIYNSVFLLIVSLLFIQYFKINWSSKESKSSLIFLVIAVLLSTFMFLHGFLK
jgi:hypothetical protein